jgi:surfeit locus 1 family protein
MTLAQLPLAAARRLRFNPPWWATLITLVLVALMASAAAWQIERGLAKQQLAAQREAGANAPPVPLTTAPEPPPAGERRAVSARGMYAPLLTVQLDNQPHRRRPGVQVWTPLILETGEVVIVDRGWLPLGTEPGPAPDGEQEIRGHWKALPAPGLKLEGQPSACNGPRPERVTYPGLDEVRCLFGERTLPGVLELDAAAPGGFTREWQASGAAEVPASRHFAYAGQWALFTLTLLFFYVRLHLERRAPTP